MNCKVYKCRFFDSHTTKGHKCGNCKKDGHGEVECGNPIKIQNLKQYNKDTLDPTEYCGFNCENKMYHTTDAHHCAKCDERYHCENTCSKNIIYQLACPLCKVINIIPNEQSKVFGQIDKCIVCMVNNINVFFPVCGHLCICSECLIYLNMTKPKYEIFTESKLIEQEYDIENIKINLKEFPSYMTVYLGMGCIMIVRRLSSNNNIEGLFIHSDDWAHGPIENYHDFIKGYCNTQNSLIKND
jgi:hypothetical protein